MSKSHVVYTCITGGYDSLREVKFRSKDIDYICFTDNANLKSSTWEVRPLPESVVSPSDKALTSVKKQRLVKLLPHKFLSEYSDSLWIDSNIEVIGDLADFFSQYSFSQKFLFTNKHPTRNCIYKEELACLRLKKDTYENMQPQIDRYLAEGYPKDNGLVETNILLRNHNDPKCKKLMSLWAEEILDGSHRDQLSYNYCVWKLGYESYVGFLGQKYSNLRFSDNAFFKLNGGHIKISDYVPFNGEEDKGADKIEAIVERKLETEEDEKKSETIAEDVEQKDNEEDQTGEKPKRNPFDLFKVTWDKAKAEVSLETVEEKKKEEKKIEPPKKKDPLVSVVFFTHERTRVARFCLKNLIENLKYENLRWIVSDDRSHEGHVEELLEELKSHGISDIAVCRTTEDRNGLGASMNNGLKEAFKNSEVVLRVEDDWLLEKELQLKKHVDVLLKNKNIAGIRIGMVGGGVDENEKMKFSGYKTLCGSDVKSWLFVNQVFLVHKRIHDAIGWYIEDKNADKVEVDFRERYNSFSKNGREKQFVLVPNEMKWRTFDDPSLWFFHVGRSMLGHSVYKPPKRYEWLYETSEEIAKRQAKEEATNRSYANVLLDSLTNSIERRKFEWPSISVMMTTHNRTNVACAVIDSLCKNLRYSGKIHWIVSDDRSSETHIATLKRQFFLNRILESDISIRKTDSKRFGLGASLNNGLREAFRFSEIVLTTEDDWILHRELNLDEYVRLLATEKDVCAIRLAALRGGNPIASRWKDFYRVICKEKLGNADYVFNNQVALRHKKIYDKLGWYVEDKDNNRPEYYMSKKFNETVNPNKTNDYQVLFPKCCAIRTIDDPSLFFIHCGRSTIKNPETVPQRYEYLYIESPKDMELLKVIEERRKISKKNLYIVMGQLNSQTNEPLDSFTFFEYLQNIGVPSRYVIWKKHYFYEKLRKEGRLKDVIALDGNGCDDFEFLYKCKEELIKCKAVVQENLAMNPIIKKWILNLKDCKHVFLQHGISFLKPQIGSIVNMLGYINVASEKEKKFIQSVAVRKVEDKRFILGGLPRFDNLIDLSNGEQQKTIFVMPTWRNTFVDNPSSIERSQYFRNLKSLFLDSAFLEELRKRNVKLAFSIHHHLKKKMENVDSFIKNSGIEIVDSNRVQEYIEKSSLCITDYSSVAFDFLFLRKPVVFWQIDSVDDKSLTNKRDVNEIRVSMEQKKKLFNTAADIRELERLVLGYVDSNFVLERDKAAIADSFFLHRKNICKELYERIEKA